MSELRIAGINLVPPPSDPVRAIGGVLLTPPAGLAAVFEPRRWARAIVESTDTCPVRLTDDVGVGEHRRQDPVPGAVGDHASDSPTEHHRTCAPVDVSGDGDLEVLDERSGLNSRGDGFGEGVVVVMGGAADRGHRTGHHPGPGAPIGRGTSQWPARHSIRSTAVRGRSPTRRPTEPVLAWTGCVGIRAPCPVPRSVDQVSPGHGACRIAEYPAVTLPASRRRMG